MQIPSNDFTEFEIDASEFPDSRKDVYNQGLGDKAPVDELPRSINIVLRLHADRYTRDEAESKARERLGAETYARVKSFATARFYVFYLLE